MIQVIDHTGQIINDFPGLLATAAFCAGTPDLWRYSFLDTTRMRYISWTQVEAAVNKRGFASGRVVNGAIVIQEAK